MNCCSFPLVQTYKSAVRHYGISMLENSVIRKNVIDEDLTHATKSDVLIIGGGFAAAVTAYNLLRLDKSISIILVEKRKIGFHDPSYYMPKSIIEELEATHLIKNIIDSLSYETDTVEYASLAKADNSFANVDYGKLCSYLLRGIEIRIDGFNRFVDRSNSIAELESGELIAADVIIDATGWESIVRRQIGLNTPRIGAKTVLWELKNCNLTNKHQMILGVGDFASLGFWLEPQSDDQVLVGSGFWDDLDSPILPEEKELMDKMLLLYLDKYQDIFKNAEFVRSNYAKISVDPVKTILKHNIISIGESAGMSNPYWLLGSSMIYDHSKTICNIIVGYLKGTNELSEVQSYWNSQLKEYGKLWASSRVLWKGDAKKWSEVFTNRDSLDQFTTKDQVVDRQKGASYKFSYARRLLGWNRILRIGYYMTIYYLRLNFKRYYEKFQEEYRTKSLIDLTDVTIQTKLNNFNNHLRRGLEDEISVESH